MPATTKWLISYPAGNVAPNVPADLEALADSVETALNRVAIAPLIICEKADGQTLATAGVFYDVKWGTEVYSTKIAHTVNDSTFIVEDAGIYNVKARVAFSGPNTTGTIWVAVNGVMESRTLSDEIGGVTAWPKPEIDHLIKLNAGDAVKIVGHSNVNSTELSSESSFSMAFVAGY